MSTGHPNNDASDMYYECKPCGYTAPVTIPIGLCPHCGEQLAEKSALA